MLYPEAEQRPTVGGVTSMSGEYYYQVCSMTPFHPLDQGAMQVKG